MKFPMLNMKLAIELNILEKIPSFGSSITIGSTFGSIFGVSLGIS